MTMKNLTTRADDASHRLRMRAIAEARRRFGDRRLHILFGRQGYRIDRKKLFRLYREEKLTVRRRGGRKLTLGARAPMLVPMTPNDRWSLDFVWDQLIRWPPLPHHDLDKTWRQGHIASRIEGILRQSELPEKRA